MSKSETDEVKFQRLLTLSQEIIQLKAQLEAKEQEARALLAGVRAAPTAPSSGKTTGTAVESRGETVSTRVKRVLVKKGPVTFGELYQGVLAGGEASKLAVRSALNYGRKKKEIVFKDDRYSIAPVRASRNGTAGRRESTPRTQETPATE